VQDLVPYFQQKYTHEQIIEIMPVLTIEDIKVVSSTSKNTTRQSWSRTPHPRTNAERTTPPAFEEIRKKGHAKVLA